MSYLSPAKLSAFAFLVTAIPTISARGGDSPGSVDRATLRAAIAAPAFDLRRFAEAWAATDAATTVLNLSVESNGSNTVTVSPGGVVGYEVVGLLSDNRNEGLALFGLDLNFDGGPLAHADVPTGQPTAGCDNPMINFTRPWGITNPDSPCPPACGFGGTIINGTLVQIGGGQNSILNTPDNAPFPIGPLLTGVAQPGGCGAVVLVTGSLIAPLTEGVYTLRAGNMFANVIKEGETGDPFWATEAAGVGLIDDLTVVVAEPTAVPSVTAWGIIVLALSLLVAARVTSLRARAYVR